MPSILVFILCSCFLTHPPKRESVILVEPSFYHRSISTLIAGAKSTVITPAWIDPSDSTHVELLEPSWKTTNPAFMNRFVEQGRETLSKHLALLHPRLLRDEHQVIQVAIIESSDPLTASTILAPEFGQQFAMIFGPEILIIIPSENRIYIFSKLASSINLIAPAIRDDYKLSSNPVSLEIFELDYKFGEQKIHTVGSLDPI